MKRKVQILKMDVQKWLMLIAGLIAFAAVIVMLIKIFKQPKPIDNYMADAPEVLMMDGYAGEVSDVHLSLRDQMGDEAYDRYVLGWQEDGVLHYESEGQEKATLEQYQSGQVPQDADWHASPTEVAKFYIDEVNENNEFVRSQGGIVEVSELKDRYQGRSNDPYLTKRIQQEIAEVTGESEDITADLYVR